MTEASFSRTTLPDPATLFATFGEGFRLGEYPALFHAAAAYQATVLKIALHAPFLPFHVYAAATRRNAPLVAMAVSLEAAVEHVSDAMTQNTRVLTHEVEVAETRLRGGMDSLTPPH